MGGWMTRSDAQISHRLLLLHHSGCSELHHTKISNDIINIGLYELVYRLGVGGVLFTVHSCTSRDQDEHREAEGYIYCRDLYY